MNSFKGSGRRPFQPMRKIKKEIINDKNLEMLFNRILSEYYMELMVCHYCMLSSIAYNNCYHIN